MNQMEMKSSSMNMNNVLQHLLIDILIVKVGTTSLHFHQKAAVLLVLQGIFHWKVQLYQLKMHVVQINSALLESEQVMSQALPRKRLSWWKIWKIFANKLKKRSLRLTSFLKLQHQFRPQNIYKVVNKKRKISPIKLPHNQQRTSNKQPKGTQWVFYQKILLSYWEPYKVELKSKSVWPNLKTLSGAK